MTTADGQGQAQSDIVVKALEAHEEQELLEFYAANLENWERFHVLWEWRKKRPGGSGREEAAIARQNGRIVGCVGVVPAPLTFGGQRLNAAWQQDSFVSSAMRGKRLGKKLVEEGTEGRDLVMAKGTNEAMYGLRKAIGFTDVRNSDYLVRVEKPRINIWKLEKSAVEIGPFVWRMVVPGLVVREGIDVRQVESFDKSFDVLSERLSDQHLVRLVKNQDYLNWRYVQCPGKRYRVFRAGGEEARGTIVLNITGPKGDEGWVVDMICAAVDDDCAHALIGEGLRHFRQNNASRIYVFATLPEARKWFRRFGFVPTGRSPRFTYKVYGEVVHSAALAGCHWDFWHGDGDVELYM